MAANYLVRMRRGAFRLFLCIVISFLVCDTALTFAQTAVETERVTEAEIIEAKKEAEANRVIEHKQKRGDWTQEIRAISEFLRIKGFLRQLVSFLQRIVRRIKIKKLIADFKIGLENPADIGLLFAFLAPLNLLMSYFSPHHIRIEPSFASENIIEGHFDGELRLRPIQLAVPLIGFAFSLPTLRAIKKLVFSKWKRKE